MIVGLIWALIILSPPIDIDTLEQLCINPPKDTKGGVELKIYEIAVAIGSPEHPAWGKQTMVWCVSEEFDG